MPPRGGWTDTLAKPSPADQFLDEPPVLEIGSDHSGTGAPTRLSASKATSSAQGFPAWGPPGKALPGHPFCDQGLPSYNNSASTPSPSLRQNPALHPGTGHTLGESFACSVSQGRHAPLPSNLLIFP